MKQTIARLFFGAASLLATAAFADSILWTGGGSDVSWSTGNNWTNATVGTSGTAPGALDDVKFVESTLLNNAVDSAFGGTVASLWYGMTNAASAHVTTIAPGKTLNLTGNSGLWVFTPVQETATGAAKSISASVTGTGTLNINNTAANLVINQGNTNNNGGRATLDMSGLDTFVANINRIGIGTTSLTNTAAPSGGLGAQRNQGVLYLAKTNTIICNYAVPLATYQAANATNALEMSKNPGNAGGTLSCLYLGQTNVFYIDSLGVGRDKANAASAGWLGFNPSLSGSSPVAYFRGVSGGASRVTWWGIGDMNANASSSQYSVGTNDFTGGVVDILVNTMSLGRDCGPTHSASGSGRINTGVLTFERGTIDVNTLLIGNQSLGPSASVTPNLGIVNVNATGSGSATLIVNTVLTLANTTQSGAAAQSTAGFLRINGGTVRANTVTVGAASTNSSINIVNSGKLVVSNTLASAAKPLKTLNMADSTFAFNLTGASPVSYVSNLITDGSANTINIDSSIVFSSYPAQVALFKYTVMSNTASGAGQHNFVLGTVPANVVDAYLSNNTANSSLDLYIATDPRPVVTNAPASYSGAPGDNVTFTVGASGVPALHYQWQRDGAIITDGGNVSGTTSDTLSITSAQTYNNGGYTVIITNSYGSTTSTPPAVLTISSGNIAPTITGPSDQGVVQGNDAVLTASVAGVPAPYIQWRKNGVDIPGANSSSYTVAAAQYPADETTYSIVATNVAGAATNSAFLTVYVPPAIAAEPVSTTAAQGAPASFTVLATGHPAPGYLWSFNGTPLADGTNATLSIPSAQPTNAGTYAVLISNPGGSTNSVTVTLTVTSTSLACTNFSPANGATGVCYDTPLYLTFNATPVIGTAAALRIYDATDTLVDTLDLSLNDGNNAQMRTIAGGTYVTYPVIVHGTRAAVYPHLGVLTSNTTYYVLMDAGFFKDLGGASFPAITNSSAWRFTTKVAGPDATVVSNVVVAADGTGDFATVQGAINWVPHDSATPLTVLIRKGIYEEINRVPNNYNNIIFVGEGCQESVLMYANNNTFQGANAHTQTRCMFYANANGLVFKNLTLTNSTPAGGSQAETLMANGARIIVDNCRLCSFQDTLLVNSPSASTLYANKTLIQGQTDYIWGSGVAYFQSCEIRSLLNGYMTQARTPSTTYGFIFADCTLSRLGTNVTSNTLGRDGGNSNPYGAVAYVNCEMDAQVPAGGWTDGGLTDKSTLRFWEYKSTDLTGTNLIDTSSRASWSQQIDATTAASLRDLTNVFSTGLTAWVPALAPYVACQPTNINALAGYTATIPTRVGGVPEPVYQWYKGSSPVPGGTSYTLTIPNAQTTDSGTYSLRGTNDYGDFVTSEIVLTVTTPVQPAVSSVAHLSNGSFQLSFSGAAGQPYRVWGSSDVTLAPIIGTWTLLSSGTFDGSAVSFTDTQATNLPQRFYSISVP